MTATYDELMKVTVSMRQSALDALPRNVAKRDWLGITTNLWSATLDSMLLALTEWRLGSSDPSRYLRQAVDDCRKLMEHFDKVTHLTHRSANMLAVWDAMYAQLLLDEPVDPSFRQACGIPAEERRSPSRYKQYWVHPWDALVFGLAETGVAPAEWDAFIAWLKDKGGGSNYIKTMEAYRRLIEAARAGDVNAVAKAIADAEKRYKARRSMPVTFGGGALAEQLVDHRLACAIKKAEQIRPGITADVQTPHRWRW